MTAKEFVMTISTSLPLTRMLVSAVVSVWLLASPMGVGAQKPEATPKLSDHVKKDIQRHRAMALAHESAARCLESGKSEDVCQKELQAACKGLAIGKYCGMRHEH
jgi:hypothetical protein